MQKFRVLIIDDEQVFTSMIKMHLEHYGSYEVKVLLQAKDILNEVHTFKPDVILLDLLLPGIGGIEVCEILNKDGVGIRTPIIIISGIAKEADKLRLYKLGVMDYLVKPLDAKDLMVSIEKVLRSRVKQ